ncbi:MAG: hypothetical protein F4227_09290 [Gammaproteobacteria bacterium]|nr:hypothetical protein [Gammaproteobacteria bacterium]MYF03143.1 hypothetical protein [Gammaproteobacteria bacterium]MYI77176.1 hypothetical protein [Gammaproteobacteria bacterium]
MNNDNKFVWLIRHGKSAWPAGTPDMERPLSQRGRRDGAIMAEVLATSEHTPQQFYMSDSERTRQTTELLNDALKRPITSTHELYTGSHREVEKILRGHCLVSRLYLIYRQSNLVSVRLTIGLKNMLFPHWPLCVMSRVENGKSSNSQP